MFQYFSTSVPSQSTHTLLKGFRHCVLGSLTHSADDRCESAVTELPATFGTHPFASPFDTNGVLFHLGTAGGTRAYQNPHNAGAVVASMSSISDGDPSRFVEHTHASPVYNFTIDVADSWMAVDLKAARLVPNHYALRSDAQSGNNKLRHWRLEASNDGQAWTILRAHSSDASLRDEAMSVAAWPLDAAAVAGRSFRHFRIVQTGANSSGANYLLCAGIELYGVLTDASR